MTLDDIDADLIEPQRLAGCVLDELRAERRWPPHDDRQRGISLREAMTALRFEVTLTAVAAGNIAAGLALSDDDRARLMIAWARIEAVLDEAGVPAGIGASR